MWRRQVGTLALAVAVGVLLPAVPAQETMRPGGIAGGVVAVPVASPAPAATVSPADIVVLSPKLLRGDLVLAQFQGGQARVAVIVNLVPPARALQPTDWKSAESRATLRAANRAVAVGVRNRLAADQHRVRFQFDNQPGFSCEVTQRALDQLLNDADVESVEPVEEMHAHLAQGIPLMNALTSRSTYDGSGLAIAICDTGIDYTHARLGGGGFPNAKVIGGYDFGDSDADPMPNGGQAHGTCCAGIAAGNLGTVGDYIGGMAPAAKLYACKISYGTSGSAYSDAMAAAWDWCVTHQNDNPANPIMVISTSFGGGRYYSTCDGSYPAMTTAANNAVAAGITVLASSGNDGYCDSMGWPACITSVISVGAAYDANFGIYQPCLSTSSCAPKTLGGCTSGAYATDSTAADKVTSYANVASFLTVFAPANKCYTLDIAGATGYTTGDYYDSFGGTSAACPYAAGAVACLQQAAKLLTGAYLPVADVRARLAATGNQLTDPKVAITKPRVNLGNALNTLQLALNVAPATTFAASGLVGGPFSPSSQSYTLSNTTYASLSWQAAKAQSWVTLSATSGTLAASAATNIVVSVNANANGLAVGSYSDTVTFTNTTSGVGTSNRTVNLTVNPLPIPQTNSWISATSGTWQDGARWSQAIPPAVNQPAVLITNAGTKTVTLDAATAASYPATMTISNLTLSSPAGSTNTLRLAAGTNLPFHVVRQLVVSNAVWALTNSVAEVQGGIIDHGGITVFGTVTLDDARLVATNDSWGAEVFPGGQVVVNSGTLITGGTFLKGSLTLVGGEYLIAVPYDYLEIGNPESPGATFCVTGGRFSGLFQIGFYSSGQMIVSNGVVEGAVSMYGIGYGPGAGTLLVAGGSVNLTNGFKIGRNGSQGQLLVTGGECFATNGTIEAGLEWGTATIGVSGGTFAAQGIELGREATFSVGGGIALVSNLLVSGSYSGTGFVTVTAGRLATHQLTVGFNYDSPYSFQTGWLTVSNGTVQADNLQLGSNARSRGVFAGVGGTTLITTSLVLGQCGTTVTGEVALTGGNLFVTNAGHTAVIDVRNGTFSASNAVCVVDRLVVTNACGRFIRTGGTVTVATLQLGSTLDADGDGLPNGWEQGYALDPLDPTGVNGAAGDFDGDGLTNLQEYQGGTNPSVSNTLLVVSPASCAFGAVAVGQTSELGLRVINAGSGTLTGTAALLTAGTPFAVSMGSPYSVAPGQTATVTVALAPVAAGNFANQVVFSSNGGCSTSQVTGAGAVSSVPGETLLVSSNTVWKYLDDGSNQGSAWRNAGFDDATWSTGPAPLGYGDAWIVTTNNYGTDANNKYISTYYRQAFTVGNPAAFATLRLRLNRDDGAIVYLNGTEVRRDLMPTGTVTYATLANGTVSGTDESAFFETTLAPSLLEAGANVIAVEVHQVTLNSSDLSFNAQLVGAGIGLRKGPYLVYGNTNTQMRVLWQTDATPAQQSYLEWGPTPAYGTSSGNLTESGAGADQHQFAYTITGLTPGAVCYYRVVVDATAATGSFVAAPATGAAQVTFYGFGDTRTYPARLDAVAAAMLRDVNGNPAQRQTMALQVGDWVEFGGTESSWQNEFFGWTYTNTTGLLSRQAVMGCVGNHDIAGGPTLLPKYWPYNGTNGWYSFDYGPVHIAVIDQYIGYTNGTAQYTWLTNDLATTTKKFKLALFHQPAFSAGGGHANDTTAQAALCPAFVQYGVQVALVGHNHYYAHCFTNGIHHVTSGGGGAPLHTPDLGAAALVAAESTYQFVRFDVSNTVLTVTAIRTNDTVIESFQVYQFPAASFAANPTGGAVSLPVSFTDTSTGAITNRSWSFGDGATTDTVATNVSHTYTLAGTYTVRLIVTGQSGASTNTQANLIVAVNPPQLVVSPASLDYGSLAVGQSSNRGFQVTNPGGQTLTGTAALETGSGPFGVGAGTPYTVAPAATNLVTISFSPSAVGAVSNRVIFASNGGTLTNLVTGTGLAPSGVIASNRTMAAAWQNAGYPGDPPAPATIVNVRDFGAVGDGVAGEDAAVTAALAALGGAPGVVYFPAGTYLLHGTVYVPAGVVIRGERSTSTILRADHLSSVIYIASSQSAAFQPVVSGYTLHSSTLQVADGSVFAAGDYAEIREDNDAAWGVTFGAKLVGQILRISAVAGNTLTLERPLRLTYLAGQNPEIRKITPITGAGVENLKVERLLAGTSAAQRDNVYTIDFEYAARCWVRGVECYNTFGGHIAIVSSTQIEVTGCYIHHAHEYDGGGSGYGVRLEFKSGECLIENNIFNHLRHSMLLQAAPNGNVLGYNYSREPTRTEFPSEVSGDAVLHGNYPYANLFEGNICQHITPDSSHGANGPWNTFFRNRAEAYGLNISDSLIINQNIVGNETFTGAYSAFVGDGYKLLGTGHFEYGNNTQSDGVQAPGTTNLTDYSYYLNTNPAQAPATPSWWTIADAIPSIGLPKDRASTKNIPARTRYFSGANFTVGPPSLARQPTNQVVLAGQTAAFVVQATGTPAARYAWSKDGAPLAGQTNATLTIANAQSANAGSYDVLVSDDYGSVRSAAAALVVTTPTVATPTISPNGGSYSGSVQVTLADSTAGASITYTTNGVDPTVASTLYTGALTLTANATVKALGFKSGLTNSAVATATFAFVSPSTATFVATDTTTQGSWKGVYGADGYNVLQNAAAYPAYVQVTPVGTSDFTWTASTTDVRAPQKAASTTDRIAACWYSATSFNVDLNFTDGQSHRVAFYFLDWNFASRQQRVDIFDAVSGAVLDTRTLTVFTGGTYLVWDFNGHVTVRVMTLAGNAVLNGLFFQTVPVGPSAATVAGASSTVGSPPPSPRASDAPLALTDLTGVAVGTGSSGSSQRLGDDSWELSGSGSGFGDSDGFYFEQMPVLGDFVAMARVHGLESSGVEPLVGLMVCEELAADARFVSLATSLAGRYRAAWFRADGEPLVEMELPQGYVYPDAWLAVSRLGDEVTLYTSADGEDWDEAQTVTVPELGEALHVGLFLSSGAPGVPARATISEFTLTPLVGSGALAP